MLQNKMMETNSLHERKRRIQAKISLALSCLHVRYSDIDGGKTLYCELYVINKHSKREHVVATDTAHNMFVEMVDRPTAEKVAYARAYSKASDFFNNMAVFTSIASEFGESSLTESFHVQNLVTREEKAKQANV